MALAAAGPAQAQDPSVNGYGGNGGNVQDVLSGGDEQQDVQSGGDEGQPDVLSGGDAEAPGGADDRNVAAADRAGTGDVDAGSLPFTGFDIALLVGGGLLLVAAGATLASANRRRRADSNLA